MEAYLSDNANLTRERLLTLIEYLEVHLKSFGIVKSSVNDRRRCNSKMGVQGLLMRLVNAIEVTSLPSHIH